MPIKLRGISVTELNIVFVQTAPAAHSCRKHLNHSAALVLCGRWRL